MWGINERGQLGLGDQVNRNTPVENSALADVKASTCIAGDTFFLCQKTDNSWIGWGGQGGGSVFGRGSANGASQPWSSVGWDGTNILPTTTPWILVPVSLPHFADAEKCYAGGESIFKCHTTTLLLNNFQCSLGSFIFCRKTDGKMFQPLVLRIICFSPMQELGSERD